MKMYYLRFRKLICATILGMVLFTSCENDDNQPVTGTITISVAENSVTEDVGSIAVTVTAGTTFPMDVVITYEVSGSASSGEDFEALSGMATLPAGDTSLVQNLIILDDSEVESAEQIIIRITAIDGAQDLVGGDGEITLTITDNDSFAFENGVLVLHEGNFGAGNASVSFLPDDLSDVQNGIFKSVNTVDSWGDTAQSITFNGDMAYIIVNNSQKIEVVNRYTFTSVTTIGGSGSTDFLNPRYMAVANGKGYVTNWGDGTNPDDDYVAIVNLETNTVESKIPVAEGPEALVANETTVYVAHQGGFNQNNIVSVIDVTSNEVSTTVTVADRPNSLQLDTNGDLWVLSGGNPIWTGNETAGQLDKISTADNAVVQTLAFEVSEHPGALSLEGSNLYYYLSGAVFKMDDMATALPETAELSDLNWADMAVNDGKLYGVDAKDFVSNGSLEIYDLGDNSMVTSKAVSVIPTGVYFNGTADR